MGLWDYSNCLQTCWGTASNWAAASSEQIKTRDLCTDTCHLVRCKELDWVWVAGKMAAGIAILFVGVAIFSHIQSKNHTAESMKTFNKRAEHIQKSHEHGDMASWSFLLAALSLVIGVYLLNIEPGVSFCDLITKNVQPIWNQR